MVGRDDEYEEVPVPPVRRNATDLHPEEIQAEFSRYNIAAGDAVSRMNALQHKYDEEYDASCYEYNAYLKKVEMKKMRHDFRLAVHNTKELEQKALAREPKAMVMVQQIEENIAPAHVHVRSITPISCCALLRAMRTNGNVMTLDLSSNALDDTIAEGVGKMLIKNKTLRTLNLGTNKLTCRFLPVLGNALRCNSVLTSLTLESNPLMSFAKDANLSVLGRTTQSAGPLMESFISALSHNSSLTFLNVYNTQMNGEVGRMLSHAMESNTSIIALELGGNAITHQDLALITNRIKRNQAKHEEHQHHKAQVAHEIHTHATEIQKQQLQEAKAKANEEWHQANARQRAEIREKEEWERAQAIAEAEVARLLEIETWNRQYREKLEAEKKAKEKKGRK